MSRLIAFEEACQMTGIGRECLQRYIEERWILPVEPTYLDDTDVARLQLILDLRDLFGANEEAIPLILHLIDQIHYFRCRLAELGPERFDGDRLLE